MYCRQFNYVAIESLEPRRLLASVSGTVYHDLDGDKLRDVGEPGMPGEKVFLDVSPSNYQLDPTEQFAITDADGFYQITSPPLGVSFHVLRNKTPGWMPSSLADPFFWGISSTENLVVNFGIKPATPPVANAGGPYVVGEFDSVLLDASASTTPIGTIYSAEWDFDYDGVNFTPEAYGQLANFLTYGFDGPATRTVAVRITNSYGGSAIATATVSIMDSPPDAVMTASANRVLEGKSNTLNLSLPYGAGPDPISGWRVDWGDGEVENLPASTTSIVHTYLDGLFEPNIKAWVIDGDGEHPVNHGAFDPTFGSGGRVRPSLSGSTNWFNTATTLADGKAVAVGYYLPAPGGDQQVLVARFNANGTLDSTFGTGGRTLINVGLPGSATTQTWDSAHDIIALPDGGVIIAARGSSSGSNWTNALIKLNNQGNLDSSFGTGGRLLSQQFNVNLRTMAYVADGGGFFALENPSATQIRVRKFQVNGTPFPVYNDPGIFNGTGASIVVDHASEAFLVRNDGTAVAVVKLMPDGTVHPTFGLGGSMSIPGASVAGSASVGPDGTLAIPVRQNGKHYVVKVSSDGVFDTTFGFAPLPDKPTGLVISALANGSIAYSYSLLMSESYAARIGMMRPDGAPDSEFAPGGTKLIKWLYEAYQNERVGGHAMDANGRMVLVGSSYNAASPTIVSGRLARIILAAPAIQVDNAPPTATFSAGSTVSVGTASTVAFSNIADPSPIDFASGFKYSFDFNNDGDFTDPGDVLNSTLASASFRFSSAGTFNVRGRISDKDGGFTDYTAAVTVNPSTPSGSVTLGSIGDAYVRDGSYAGTNFGSTITLDVKKDGSGSYRESYIKFDISSLSGITSAKLRLFGKLSDAVTGGLNVSAYDVADNSWVESTIKFTGRPVSGALAATANVPSKTAQWIEWDLTSYLQARKSAGATQVTLVLKALAGGALISFNSNNASTSKPELLVTQGTVVTPQSLIVSTSSLSMAEGGSSSFTVKLATAPASNVIVNIARSGDTDVNAVLSTLTFTPSNWNTAQTVNVNAGEDADTTHGSATLTISSSSLSDKTVTVTEIDNDVPPSPDVTLAALEDAFVRDGTNANTNYGSSTVLEVKKDGVSNYRESYLKFDIGSLGTITTAKLRLFGKLSNTVTGGINVSLYDVSSNAWTESTLNFSNKPAGGALIGTVNMTSTANGWIEWDLATYLSNARTAGRTQVTLVLKAMAGGALISFNSRNATSNQPQIVVTGGAVTPVQNIIVSTSSLSVNEGSSNSFTVKLATAPASNVTVNLARTGDSDLSTSLGTLTFIPGNWNTPQTVTINAAEDVDLTNGTASFTLSSAGLTDKVVTGTEVDNDVPPSSTITLNALQDAHVRDGTNANINYGANASLEVKKDGAGAYREAYIQFDLTSLTTITSAKLRLFGKLSDPVASGINVGVHDVTGSWAEGTINYATRPASNTTPITTINLLGTTAKWYEWDLTSYLQAKKAAGATSVSLVLRAQAGGALITFNSKNNVSNQPQLVIN